MTDFNWDKIKQDITEAVKQHNQDRWKQVSDTDWMDHIHSNVLCGRVGWLRGRGADSARLFNLYNEALKSQGLGQITQEDFSSRSQAGLGFESGKKARTK